MIELLSGLYLAAAIASGIAFITYLEDAAQAIKNWNCQPPELITSGISIFCLLLSTRTFAGFIGVNRGIFPPSIEPLILLLVILGSDLFLLAKGIGKYNINLRWLLLGVNLATFATGYALG